MAAATYRRFPRMSRLRGAAAASCTSRCAPAFTVNQRVDGGGRRRQRGVPDVGRTVNKRLDGGGLKLKGLARNHRGAPSTNGLTAAVGTVNKRMDDHDPLLEGAALERHGRTVNQRVDGAACRQGCRGW
jgi:hypothetical protein